MITTRRAALGLMLVLTCGSRQAWADECPLPFHPGKDGAEISPAELAAFFARIKPIIFLGRIEASRLKGFVDGDAVLTTKYRVLERMRGEMPDEFEADQTEWCDACTAQDIAMDADDMVGKTGIVMGSLAPGQPASALRDGGCFGFVPTDFMNSGDRLLPALRAAARQPFHSR